jgi:hypothetical protein
VVTFAWLHPASPSPSLQPSTIQHDRRSSFSYSTEMAKQLIINKDEIEEAIRDANDILKAV